MNRNAPRALAAALFSLLFGGAAGAQVVAMTNDDCSTAIVVFDGINPGAPAGVSGFVFTTVGASLSAGPAFCANVTQADTWFSYTATYTGQVIVSTCTPPGFASGTAPDTVLQVLTSECPATTAIGCNDQFCSGRSQVTTQVVSGQTYLIRVGPWSSTPNGTFNLTITPLWPPSNDECAAPTPVFDGVNPGAPAGGSGNFFLDLMSATPSTGMPAFCATVSQGDAWYSYTASVTGSTTISTCTPAGFAAGTAMDTVIQVLTNTCPAPTPITCNDQFCTSRAQVVVAMTAGATYLIRVAAVSTTTAGTFYLTIVPPPPNDECASPTPVFDGINPGAPAGSPGSFYTLLGATVSPGPPFCAVVAQGDLWFSYTATTTGLTTFSTCTPGGFVAGTAADTTLDVLTNTCPTPVSLACNDQFCTGRAQVSVQTTAGTAYLIRVAPVALTTAGTFNLTIGAAPPNDDCLTPVAVNSGSNGPFTNLFGTDSGMSVSCGLSSSGYKDVFFLFVPSCSGDFQIDTDSAPFFDTILGVFDACNGTEIACDDDGGVGGGGLASLIPSVTLTGGTPYIICVASWSSTSTGTFNVNIGPAGGGGVAWSSPLGLGSVQFDITGGPAGGTYYHALEFFAGNFPNGWFFGLDIAPQEIVNQILFGFPFTASLGACGGVSVGPFQGLPSGLAIYSVAILMTGPGLTGAATATAPVSYVIP